MPVKCPHCGQEVIEGRVLCPHCGSAINVAPKPKGLKKLFRPSSSATRPIKTQGNTKPQKPRRESAVSMTEPTQRIRVADIVARKPKPEPEPAPAPAPVVVTAPEAGTEAPVQHKLSRRKILMTMLIGFIAVVVMVAALAASALAGYSQGEQDRAENRQLVIEEHYQAGLVNLNNGRFELAVAEFAYVLQLDPDNVLAEEGRSQAQARLDFVPTPTMEVVVDLSLQLLEQAQASYAAEDWVSTAGTLTQLRALDSEYEQEAVEAMLFESLRNAGKAYFEVDNLEVAISYLDQAIALQPLDADLLYERNQAARYLDALNFWAVDWDLAIEHFTAMVQIDPNYKDVYNRLYRAYVSYGDFYADGGEMCPAEVQYSQALQLYADATLEQRRDDAAATCLIATPIPVDGINPSGTAQPITGFNVGRLAYPVYNASTGTYDIYTLFAEGTILKVASNAVQPWWEWGTGRLAYYDRSYNGISLVQPGGSVAVQLLSGQGQSAPALSPDSLRVAYSATGTDGNAHIFVVDTQGATQPVDLGIGWQPAWGRNGVIAYTGCIGGSCGIILDNPDDAQPGNRLTGSAQDSAIAWAPGSNLLAYQSNVTGSWDLYLLSPEGGVQTFLSDAAVDEVLPTWAPDGSAIAYISNRGGSWGVYVKPFGDQVPRRILDLGPELPSWEGLRLSWGP